MKIFKIPSKQKINWIIKWRFKIRLLKQEHKELDNLIYYIQLMDDGVDMYIKKEKIKAINKYKKFETKLHRLIELYNQNTCKFYKIK
jgi:hypothetical protein